MWGQVGYRGQSSGQIRSIFPGVSHLPTTEIRGLGKLEGDRTDDLGCFSQKIQNEVVDLYGYVELERKWRSFVSNNRREFCNRGRLGGF